MPLIFRYEHFVAQWQRSLESVTEITKELVPSGRTMRMIRVVESGII